MSRRAPPVQQKRSIMRQHPIPGAVSHLTRALTVTTATIIAFLCAFSPGASAGRDARNTLLETLAS